ncbi:Holliday junction branch migration protein RuvA [Alphaproteobacteria bacterium]|jgi:Holliday junction DNA helicase RuvA|nr:Holliday junction branch migration protein RuvA [Alphaproteobacteria bacterium]MDB2684191.1 Holliday junction branch migration protein RuvA [Alphaproteobacteria bacterium]MDC3410083.1 Holliday junction branch migration protein RuvA [Alphaproteobacteria bacterium]
MIASLTGNLASIGKSEIILEVNGVGYLLNVSSKLVSSLGEIGSKLSVFTDLQIKDDKILMYGFATSNEQSFFRLLQSVQGIGPKAALSILSALTINELILAITSGDKAMISRADGVGPKVAARVTAELSEKVSNMHLNFGNNDISKNSQEKNSNVLKSNFLNEEDQFFDVVEDTISALINLGYTRSEVFSVVMAIKKDFNLKKINLDFTVNAIIPLALKELSKVVK